MKYLNYLYNYLSPIKKMDQKESSHKGKAKKEEDNFEIKSCQKCSKFFTTEQAYDSHIKIKHCQNQEEREPSEESEEEGEEEDDGDKLSSKNLKSKSNQKNIPFKNRMLEIQRNELEDNIYTFLGQLGEKNAEPMSNRSQFIFQSSDNQKLTGQTNYSVNKVIRTPYEEPIKCSEEAPLAQISKSRQSQFLLALRDELAALQQKVEAQRQIWELRDPMAPQEETQDEFSLMDIRKLIQNYPKRKINLKYPHFSIYLLWIGRICKSPAFKEFYMILGDYIGEYYSNEAHRAKGQGSYDNWANFYKAFEGKKVDAELLQNLKIFDEKTCKKFIEYYSQWVSLFKALSI